jgi:hypothetical protein
MRVISSHSSGSRFGEHIQLGTLGKGHLAKLPLETPRGRSLGVGARPDREVRIRCNTFRRASGCTQP